MEGVIHASKRLRTEGLDPELQKKLDAACVAPHLHPRNLRNDNTWTPRNGKRKGPYDKHPHDHRDEAMNKIMEMENEIRTQSS